MVATYVSAAIRAASTIFLIFMSLMGKISLRFDSVCIIVRTGIIKISISILFDNTRLEVPMLTYSLEKDGGESLYTQLYACIRRDILSGTLSPCLLYTSSSAPDAKAFPLRSL